jgi:metacaspase-1
MTVDFALCIGVDRYGNGANLAGCVNDALDWGVVLKERGAQTFNLTDGAATRQGIIGHMTEMVALLRRGQTGVITFSGHGTWVPDEDGDEPDRRDEAICPVDLWDNGVITDDELFKIFTSRAYGSRLIFVSDSCHSGSVNRLAGPLLYHIVDRKTTVEGWDVDNRPVRLARFLAPSTFLTGNRLERAQTVGHAVGRSTTRTSALTLTGCRDEEYSYDAWFPQPGGGQRANGAFSRVAIDVLRRMPQIASYRDWHAEIRNVLPSADFPQTPQLAGTYDQKRWPLL